MSVPIFLIQADGICRERFLWDDPLGSVELFSAKKPKKILSEMSKNFHYPFLSLLTFQAQNTLVKTQTQKDGETRLNRNLVLHGCDTEYDSRENSLRAMAAVDFAIWLCKVADDADEKLEAKPAKEEK